MYPCNLCGARCYTIGSYVRHVRIHRNISRIRIKCCFPSCVNTFATTAALATHISRYHRSGSDSAVMTGTATANVSLHCALQFCGQTLSNVSELIRHIKSHLAQNMTVVCPFLNCGRVFKKKPTFTSHLCRQHKNYSAVDVDTKFKVVASATQSSEATAIDLANDEMLEESFDDSVDTVEEDLNKNLKKTMAQFYLRLQSKLLVPSSTIQIIADEMTCVNGLNRELLLKETRSQLSAVGLPNETISNVLINIQKCDPLAVFSNELRTDYLRKKTYKEQFSYIEPKEILLGSVGDGKLRHAWYIPVKLTIQSLFKHACVQKQHQHPIRNNANNLHDITHGSVFCSNKLFQNKPSSLKIILYQDAFEIVNPLGSAKKKHKILGVYMTLADIYPWNRATVDQLQLVLLCREADLKLFGWTKVLSPLIEDLKEIETVGIVVHDDVLVNGSIVSVVGDNLGSHGIGGFVENFNASHFCRYCLLSRDTFSKSPTALGETRTVQSYNSDVEVARMTGVHSNGVKADSVLNSLNFFHVCNPGLPPCIAHDLFEGVVDVDLLLYIKHMVQVSKWFSFEYLNRRIEQFKYKGDDAANKPSTVNCKSDRLGGHAVQNWTLLRFLSLLIGDKVTDPEDEVWQLYLLLKVIVEIVCSKSISHEQIAILHSLVEDYLYRRAAKFPNCKLKPKHHYLMHYAGLTLKFGPLMHQCTLRFESKHSYFKRCIRNCQNFKNACKTLAERHQLLQAYINDGKLFPDDVTVQSAVMFNCDMFSTEINRAIAISGLSELNTSRCSRVSVRGCTYEEHLYVTFFDDSKKEIVFGKILLILLSVENDVYFLVELLHSEYLADKHVYYLTPISGTSYKCIQYDTLCHFGPLSGYKFDGGVVVTLKYSLPA